MKILLSLYVLFIAWGGAFADITFEFTSVPGDVSVDTLEVEGVTYHKVSVTDFPFKMNGVQNAGLPSVPFSSQTFLLPPDVAIDTILITSEEWTAITGKYYLFPAQTGIMTDTGFTLPDSIVYNSEVPFPQKPVEITRQGSAMGYSVASLAGTPLRYIPADSVLEVLTGVTLSIQTGSSESERVVPNRETEWSAAMRERGILSLVSNPEAISFYQTPVVLSFQDRTAFLDITQSPSPEGDGVDMVIITSEELADDFEHVADYRTRQGIVTVIRTVEWIDQFYSGCDTPERMRNFIQDAHEEWGTQAVLLGGDDSVVPVRECKGLEYEPDDWPEYELPSDDYYADIDGAWSNNAGEWLASETDNYLDLCIGRWPVENADDVDLIFNKLMLYEWPDEFPEEFARKLLLLESQAICTGMQGLVEQLTESGAVPQYLDEPTELYYPHSLPEGDLTRKNALYEFDQGYSLIIHADHSGVHEIGTASAGTPLGQAMYDYDFSTMGNTDEPSILWTLGCDPGWFDGADCFAEAGLLTSPSTGLVAVIANSRLGYPSQYTTYYAFCDALFSTGWIAEEHGCQSLDWPLSYLGEAHRCSKNQDWYINESGYLVSAPNNLRLNFLGSPLMYVWRDDPEELDITGPPILLREGVSQNVTVTVTDGVDPVKDATVCLWKKGELFSVEHTDSQGQVTFENICVANGSSDVIITAVKRRDIISPHVTTVISYIPDQLSIDVLPSNTPIVTLEDITVDAAGDGTANPGETVDIYVSAANSGGETAQNVSAEVTIVSGQEHIASIPDDQMSFPNIDEDETEGSNDPFTVVVRQDVDSYSTVEFNVEFTFSNKLGQQFQWESPLFMTIYSEGYELTVVEPTADNSSGITAEITLSDMFLANSGLGEGSDLEITVANLTPSEPFSVNTLTHSYIEANTCSGIEGEIILTVSPGDPGTSPWTSSNRPFEDCSFDVVVSSNGGEFIARNVDVEAIEENHIYNTNPPDDFKVYEVGQDYISVYWDYTGIIDSDGFYIYVDGGSEQYRAFPLPVPVEQLTIEDLLPGTDYSIDVTTVDIIGRESGEVANVTVSTTCPLVSGWPLQLEGSPGGGPAIADIDDDGLDEIVVATSFGYVYIIERNGSYTSLAPPADYDFDKFLGCAVGDVDGDSYLEIVVSCQKKIDVVDEEQAAILLFDRNGMIWNVEEIATTNVNEEVASPYIAGTPVLFQANGTGYMEIALRTKGEDANADQNLYSWKYDQNSGDWVSCPEFPVNLRGWVFSEPTAVDFDEDGFEELIVISHRSSGGTELIIADFEYEEYVSVTTHDLSDDLGDDAYGYGTLASAYENGNYYIAGVVKKSGSLKGIYVYSLNTNPVSLTHIWKTEWLNGWDFCSNIPGPSIGNVDGDSDLEVAYSLNGGEFNKEGIVYCWDLSEGSTEFRSDFIPFNPVVGSGAHIKSQPVVGLTTTNGSDDMTVFSGFSSYCCGHDPSNNNSMLGGFPSWTRDGSWATPAICDLDGDNVPEVLYIDYSGFASLFDWDDGYYTDDGWHMYQDNPHRNGFYNYSGFDSGLDIKVTDCHSSREARIDSGIRKISAVVNIIGALDIAVPEDDRAAYTVLKTDHAGASQAAITDYDISRTQACLTRPSAIPLNASSEAYPFSTVEVAAFSGSRMIGSTAVPLTNGSHKVEIPLGITRTQDDDIRIVADPFNEYVEFDETNNTLSVVNQSVPDGLADVFIPSPAEAINLSISLSSVLPRGIEVRVYSLAGRLVSNYDSGELQAGQTNVLLREEGESLPTGVYTVCITGLGSRELIRKVVILNNGRR